MGLSFRVRLVLLVLLALAPPITLLVWNVLEQRADIQEQAKETALRTIRLAVRDQAQFLAETRQLLTVLASHPPAGGRDAAACSAELEALRSINPRYAFIGYSDAQGGLGCTAPALPAPLNIGDRDFFHAVMNGAPFAESALQHGRISGVPVIVGAVPRQDASGRFAGAVVGSISIGWLKDFAERAQLPPGSILTVIDHEHRVLVRYPDPQGLEGQVIAEGVPLRALLDPSVPGVQVSRASGLDDVVRVYAVSTLGRGDGLQGFVTVGVDPSALQVPLLRATMRNTVLGVAGVLLALLLAYVFGTRALIRPLGQLMRMVDRWHAGDWSGRAELRSGSSEMRRLGETLDRMSDTVRAQLQLLEAKSEQNAVLNRTYALLSATNSAIVRLNGREELIREVCRIAVNEGGFNVAWYGQLEPDKRHLQIKHSFTTSNWDGLVPRHGSMDLKGCGDAGALARLQAGAAYICPEPSRAEPVDIGWLSGIHDLHDKTFVLLPIHVESRLHGVFYLGPMARDSLDPREQRLLEELGADVSLGLTTIERARHIDYLAAHDVLTGLLNESQFIELANLELASVKRHRRHAAVLCVQIRRFAHINHAFGHRAGDELLRNVGRVLREHARTGDIVARTGGARFAVLLNDVRSVADLPAVIDQLMRELPAEVHDEFGDQLLELNAAAGVAVFPADGDNCRVLLDRANAVLAAPMPEGALPVRYYTDAVGAMASRRMMVESALAKAEQLGQLQLVYQPMVRASDLRPMGVEALLRWQHPELGSVSPGEFIPIAESSNLILRLGAWVLREACRASAVLADAGLGGLTMSVNVSPRQLAATDAMQFLNQSCGKFGPARGGLSIELTETSLMEHIDTTRHVLEELRHAGAEIAIDDFGTGYSSLAYLQRLPLDKLKIDLSFVRGLPGDRSSREIVAAIVSLANSLELTVVAEGVETEAQLQALRELGCELIQGYLISKPLPLEALQSWLAEALAD